ncbi:MAG: hypothetical protein PHR77_21185 [Kiritimatiellae bacterium]|nr:hypothetical protein [Kiritimatiellia bacterium]MDD5521979.1 hypothetical protein [Kiritimatiellia bacterium]
MSERQERILRNVRRLTDWLLERQVITGIQVTIGQTSPVPRYSFGKNNFNEVTW